MEILRRVLVEIQQVLFVNDIVKHDSECTIL